MGLAVEGLGTVNVGTGCPPQSCPKCDGDDISVHWHRGGYTYSAAVKHKCGYGDFAKPSGEHLHHYCRVCGFDWFNDVREHA
jgi:hypothetical protein